MSDRMNAIHSLVKQFQNDYPKEGFIINPSITFVENKKTGICVKAKRAIISQEILLAIPESEQITSKQIHVDIKTTILLIKLMSDVEHQLSIIFHDMPSEVPDHVLAFAMMHALSKKVINHPANSIFIKYAATLPSHLEMRDNMVHYWTEEKLNIIGSKNSFMRRKLDMTKELVILKAFQQAIFPILNDLSKDVQMLFVGSSVTECCDYKTIEEYLWETYLHAFTIVGSRAFGQVIDPHLVPLADLFNGASEWNPDGLLTADRSNVFLESKNWSVINNEDSHFDKEFKIDCNVVYALRDIEEGEELFISYGSKSVSEFLLYYGTIPLDLFQLNKAESMGLLIPPDMIPNDNNKRRIVALEKNGSFQLYYLRRGEAYVTCLESEDYYINEKIYESDSVSSLRQFILLGSIASDEEVESYITTGRLHCTSVSNEIMCRALCKVIDYNITILDPTASSSMKDYERANHIDTPFWEKNALLLRICQRETLLMWRHHFCRRFHLMIDKLVLQNNDEGCRICGRTYPIMKCTRCKGAIYCSRSHQVVDWKAGHKLTCRTEQEVEKA